MTRRDFMRRAGAGAAGAVRATRGMSAAARPAAEAERQILFQFNYSDVKLTGGPLLDQFQRIHSAYLTLDEDQVLKVYRRRAGLPAPGPDMEREAQLCSRQVSCHR